ncbi:MAG TPA: ethanolamine utilization protein EutP [Firmicutes bacterium]|nr:ethanolamine utilization protein EutP [Bacillota bacterium]
MVADRSVLGKKRILVIGASGSGKTSLITRLRGSTAPVRKTQALEFHDILVDSPGEYVQIPRLFFTVLCQVGDAQAVWVVQDASSELATVPPGFARPFSHKAVGVITKIDRADANISRAAKLLTVAGVPGPYYTVSVVTGEGIKELEELLNGRRHNLLQG